MRPLTETRPKALIEVGGMPLLEFSIRRLKLFGFREIMINIHQHGEQILDFLEKNNRFGIHIEVSDERDLLLDTGGGGIWVDVGKLFELEKAAGVIHQIPIAPKPT